ncbi:hypothetical protein F5B22DRAFT_651560 [Xylaria bambusicola]|uniref:uncharacterized protein n=1 Tax=Xylaria bambusicola TaxID=326684 RepID=UPI0020072D9F|nr:uncharacterized protein F5B22DRAFT_651560 [Xylaria bambusicola]KAI0505626.1 hypothetical protein F5B22DRAFT_651560 [Xylaria bambusicola]
MLTAIFLLSSLALATRKLIDGLDDTDCQLRCPKSADRQQVILPAITQVQHKTGEWENILECWSVKTTTPYMPGVDNAFRINWESGFDALYQYIFYDTSFMPPHSTPEPSLAIMSAGIGDVRVPSGRCLRVKPGDIFFNVGIQGLQTAWWSEDAVISDLYFKGGKIPEHEVVPELPSSAERVPPKRAEL